MKRVVSIVSWVLLGAAIGVCVAVVSVMGWSSPFRSLAKIVVNGESVDESTYSTIIQTLESAELRHKTRESVHARFPDLKVSGVEIRVAQTKGSGILNILATGAEPKLTQIFLNTLLDEYISLHNEQKPKSADGSAIYSDNLATVNVLERATTASEHTQAWTLPVLINSYVGAVAGLLVSLLIAERTPSNKLPQS